MMCTLHACIDESLLSSGWLHSLESVAIFSLSCVLCIAESFSTCSLLLFSDLIWCTDAMRLSLPMKWMGVITQQQRVDNDNDDGVQNLMSHESAHK